MGNRSDEQHMLLTDYDASSTYTESYRTLYANICFNWKSNTEESPPQHCHTLLFTTPSTSADDAAIAANLAIVAAQSGTPTLLVDANLRSPSLQQRFGLGKSAGLCKLLAEESITPQKVATHLQTTFVPGLRLLGAGTATGSAATLLSANLEEVLCNIRCHLDETESKTSLVIFHSSPVLAGADASLIGALVEQTLLTISVGYTTRTQLKQAQEQLQRAHAKLVGIIMSNI